MTAIYCCILALATLVMTSHAWGDPASPSNYYQVITDVTHTFDEGFEPEFGYAVYIHYDGADVLFDTGATPKTLEHNLRAAAIDPRSIDILVVSHNHPDHIGGISYMRKSNPAVKVYAPPAQPVDGDPVERVSDVYEISPNLLVLRTHTNIPTVGISDELSMLIKTAQGPYVLTACSHTGVAKIMAKAAAVAGREIFHYTGGARLKFRGVRDTEKVADELNRLRVSQVSPGHCSIDHAVTKTMRQRFNGRVISSALGQKIPLHTPEN